mmetsp:Transcript_14412/g.18883  ORF Transcript_14412/g.18883 Transcript_14412/m.18883 type:complete len:946 (-) Transcript_14412:444-3281(-)
MEKIHASSEEQKNHEDVGMMQNIRDTPNQALDAVTTLSSKELNVSNPISSPNVVSDLPEIAHDMETAVESEKTHAPASNGKSVSFNLDIQTSGVPDSMLENPNEDANSQNSNENGARTAITDVEEDYSVNGNSTDKGEKDILEDAKNLISLSGNCETLAVQNNNLIETDMHSQNDYESEENSDEEEKNQVSNSHISENSFPDDDQNTSPLRPAETEIAGLSAGLDQLNSSQQELKDADSDHLNHDINETDITPEQHSTLAEPTDTSQEKHQQDLPASPPTEYQQLENEELSSDSSVPNSPVQLRLQESLPETPSSLGESPGVLDADRESQSLEKPITINHKVSSPYSDSESDDGETQLLDRGEVRIPQKVSKVSDEISPCSKGDDQFEENSAVPAPSSFPTDPVPCMKGDLAIHDGHHICKGSWGMTRESHDAGDVSLFEYRSNLPADIEVFPHCGFYKGYFMVRQPPPRNPLRVEEKALYLKFVRNTEGTYNLEGNGSNRYGVYTMSGILEPNGYIEFYRSYQSIKVPARPGRKTPGRQKSKKQTSSKKKPPVKIVSEQKTIPSPITIIPQLTDSPGNVTPNQRSEARFPKRTPRSSRGSWKDIAGYDNQEKKKPKGLKRKLSTLKSSNEHNSRGRVGRPKQPNSFFDDVEANEIDIKFTKDVQRQLCEFMSFMMSRKNSFWFNEPVDPEVLNIPDYFDIISKPMDFGTVSSKLKAGMYKRVDDVAADVRLTLKNAVTYNVQKDNPVNIAAKDLSKVFEERYKKLRDKLVAAEMSKQKSGRQKSAKKNKLPGVGPRPAAQEHTGDVVPSSYLVKMQEQMMQMQQTIMALQKQQSSDIATPPPIISESTESEPLGAMTFHEKRALSENINKLAPEKLARVVQIIQESIPLEERSEDDEIEIDIDSLDQATLRRLEVYVKQSLRRKRGPKGVRLRDQGLDSGSSDG